MLYARVFECSGVIKVIIDAGLARYRRCFTHSPNPQNGLSGGGISRIQKKKKKSYRRCLSHPTK